MKIVFMGTPQAAVPSLVRVITDGHEVVAVYSQPDRPSGRGNKITFSPVKQCSIENGIAVYQPEKVRTPEAIELFRAHGADVAVVVAYGRILPKTFLTAYSHGAINVHFSLLPKYRGAAPVNWAIANGEKETGVTTMQMDIGLDTGAILMQRSTRIEHNETSIELMERLSFVGAELLSETLANYASLTPIEQDHAVATLAPIMKREDGLIDWEMSAIEIANRVRGFQPFPSSFTSFRGGKLTVWKAVAVEGAVGAVAAGTIIEASNGRMVITCGDNTALLVEEVQAEGKRRMTVRDFLNGVKVTVGEQVGQ
ncbi:MAG: methionyl-tRNA formyltransferase [Pyrinomonadaceae bacterium]|nr:methionyl-tRNA formyltransferase [Pyrinomonadaceae bacterium]MBP9108190.1 methionyl-tRNA formyltransferase [Pyrinomonadaceae bacterium]